MFWKLMPSENISLDERNSLANFILNTDKFTQGEYVKKFEKEWSEWQNCKYSVFVNSGSSANLLLVKSMIDLYGNGGLICQSTTWPTNINPALQLKGIDFLQLCDNNLYNFGPEINQLKDYITKLKPKYLFITHVLGFNAFSQEIQDLCYKNGVKIIEDCCESHGASYYTTKVGNLGEAGTFSFYYGHHMTTIEGGMISTNNKDLYNQLIINRSHGLLREHPEKELIETNCDRRFTFLTDGFNFRNTEINAYLGCLQLPKLTENIKIRNKNYEYFMTRLDPTKYYTSFITEGLSSFAFPIISKNQNIEKLKEKLTAVGIENRPFIAGNLSKQIYMNKVNMYRDFPNSDLIHTSGMYLGNNQFITNEMMDVGLDILNGAL